MRNTTMKSFHGLTRAVLNITGRGKLSILIYHRVLAVADGLFPDVPHAGTFDERMSWVAATLNVIPLSEAFEMLHEGRLPPRATCITFDDGYADNEEIALPILRRHRLSATFFVATGFLDGGRMWNDTIIEAIRRAPGTTLDLELLGLGKHAIGDETSRRATIDEIIGRLKYLPPNTRQMHVDALAHAIGNDLPHNLMMRSEQVRTLHSSGMSIGGHTVTHPILARIDDAEARSEIRAGREALESILGSRVNLFAYPNGKPGTDYGPGHVTMVRELGFTAALSTRAGAADASSDRYQLPRFTPWGNTARRFGIGLARNHLGHY